MCLNKTRDFWESRVQACNTIGKQIGFDGKAGKPCCCGGIVIVDTPGKNNSSQVCCVNGVVKDKVPYWKDKAFESLGACIGHYTIGDGGLGESVVDAFLVDSLPGGSMAGVAAQHIARKTCLTGVCPSAK